MNYLKMLGHAALPAMALMAFAAGTASATTLEVGGVKQIASVSLTATIKAGATLSTKDEAFETWNTCASSELKASTTSPFTGATLTGKVSTLLFANCQRTFTTHTGGTLHFSHISGTTNATVAWSGSEVTTNSVFGYLNCKTGAGTHLGTMTGSASGHAEIDVSANVSCSGVALNLSGTYTFTSPTGLGAVA